MHSIHTFTAWDTGLGTEIYYLWCERCGLTSASLTTPPSSDMSLKHLRATYVFLETSCSEMLAMRATHWFELSNHYAWRYQPYFKITKVNEQELGVKLLYATQLWSCKICGYDAFIARVGDREETAHFVMHNSCTCERHQKLMKMKRALK